MPQSPRWLMDQGREEECRDIISNLRRLPPDAPLVEMEFLEVKAQRLFEERISQRDFPQFQDGSFSSRFQLGLRGYASLVTNRGNFKRTAVAVLVMTFQQWTGVNFILYYAPFIFQRLGLSGKTISLLASGVVGIVMFIATIPAVLYVDQWGRKPTLIVGAIVMGVSELSISFRCGVCLMHLLELALSLRCCWHHWHLRRQLACSQGRWMGCGSVHLDFRHRFRFLMGTLRMDRRR